MATDGIRQRLTEMIDELIDAVRDEERTLECCVPADWPAASERLAAARLKLLTALGIAPDDQDSLQERMTMTDKPDPDDASTSYARVSVQRPTNGWTAVMVRPVGVASGDDIAIAVSEIDGAPFVATSRDTSTPRYILGQIPDIAGCTVAGPWGDRAEAERRLAVAESIPSDLWRVRWSALPRAWFIIDTSKPREPRHMARHSGLPYCGIDTRGADDYFLSFEIARVHCKACLLAVRAEADAISAAATVQLAAVQERA